MTLHERLRRTGDAAAQALARRLPRRVRYWAFIHSGVETMPDDVVVTEARYVDLLARIEK